MVCCFDDHRVLGVCLIVYAGVVMNMQPSKAEAGFNIRFPPTVDPDLVWMRIAEECAPAARNLTFQVSLISTGLVN